jgi:hypothetical protein
MAYIIIDNNNIYNIEEKIEYNRLFLLLKTYIFNNFNIIIIINILLILMIGVIFILF